MQQFIVICLKLLLTAAVVMLCEETVQLRTLCRVSACTSGSLESHLHTAVMSLSR